MVLYDYYSNTILTYNLKNHTTQELVRAHNWLIQYLFDRDLKPLALRIDNEFPKALQGFFRANSVNFQLCPPNYHRTNQGEKAIDTWNCHLLSEFSGGTPFFPCICGAASPYRPHKP